MSRDMTGAMAAEVCARQIRCALFAELHFASSVERVWSGLGTLSWDGYDWLGIGTLGKVGVVTEDSQLNAQALQISLSGIDSDLLSYALGEVQQGLPVKLWFATFDDAGNITVSPTLCYAGRMDQISILQDTSTATIGITVENRLSDLQRKVERRFTDRDQRLNYPNDLGFAFIAWTMDWNGSWGSNSS
jgi:hypothetical protein